MLSVLQTFLNFSDIMLVPVSETTFWAAHSLKKSYIFLLGYLQGIPLPVLP